jgi:hypothetical protein
MPALTPLERLTPVRFEAPAILKKLASSSRKLAELKGIAASIPNQGILISTLGLQEAKDSSEIENIVTTHDELFKDEVLPEAFTNPAAKEVLRYRQALRVGFERVRETGLLTNNHIVEIQGVLEENNAGFRKLPGTALKDGIGRTVYTPPQDPAEIVVLMSALERFINESDLHAADPLIKMDGAKTYVYATRTMAAVATAAIERAGLTPSQVNLVIPHQANIRIIEHVSKAIDYPMDQIFVNLDKYGNTSAASIPIALSEAVAAGRLKPGDVFCTVAFGGGYTSGAFVTRWDADPAHGARAASVDASKIVVVRPEGGAKADVVPAALRAHLDGRRR